MEERVRSGGGLVKKKNSSGCLIIKKRGVGVGSSGSRKVFESNKERKRPRLVVSESESSDSESLEPIRRKVVSGADKFHNGSAVYRKDIVEDSKLGRNGEIESDKKRRLDVFEFDEYDGIDGKRMRMDFSQDRFKLTGRGGSEREFETGSSRHVMIDKGKNSHVDSRSNSSGRTGKSRYETEDDEAHLPISSLKQKFRVSSDEPIRLQGKNGVLKVMVNKKKKMDLPHKFTDHKLEIGDRKGSKSENAIKKNVSARPSFYSDSKRPDKAMSFVKTEKSELKLQNSLSKSAKAGNSETKDCDASLKLGSTSVQAHTSLKGVKSEGKAPSAQKVTPVRGKEVKINRGSGTEKQLLREKIRDMLVKAGWTIDYRPRRNRDYLDAVYISPSGTAYWSIIKAYDALQKQLDEEDVDIKPSGDCSSFTPLPEEMLSKLTRQTRKKIEKEMKLKRRDHGRSKNVKKVSREESSEGTDGENDDDKLSFFMKQNGKPPKGRSYASGDDSSGNLNKGSPKQDKAEKPSSATNFHMIQGRKSRKIGRCTLLVRSSDKGLNSESDGCVPYTGKRTLLSWLIDSGTVQLSEKVQYMNRRRTRVILEGWITRDGVHCGCCSKILTVSKFEIHAGSKLRQPFQNIFLESGVSLLQCQIDAWNRQDESERFGFHTVDTDGDDPNDDTCGLCGDGGDLICCDGCPSTFHQSCLDIEMLPPGDWHCPNCTCKFCGIAGEISAQGNYTTVSALLTCSLCEKKYHESCSQEIGALPADTNGASTSFCGQKCRELFDHLQKLLGVKHELEAGFSWSLIHRTDLDTDASHRGYSQRVECNSKLAVALSVMDECFLPIVDRRSGVNLIHNVVYNCGSNFSRLNYTGFYTVILERGDEIIAAASIRIHGTQLAEMPFIGTRHIYRRQGMCRRLFCAIESALGSLKVEKLIIPAIAEHMHTWTVVFGFYPLEESQKQEMRSVNMLVFPGTDMLQKLLGELKTTEGKVTANSDAKPVPIKEDHHLMPDLTKKDDVDSSVGHDLNIRDDAGLHNADKTDDKAAAVDSSLQAPAVPSNDNALLDSSLNVPSEPKLDVLSESQSVKESTDEENPAGLHNADETDDKAAAVDSGLQAPALPLHDSVRLDSSLDVPSEPKLNVLSESQPVKESSDEENPVLDPSVKGNSSEEGVVNTVQEANVEVAVIEPVLDLFGESSVINTAEEIKGDQNPLCACAINGTDEDTKQSNSELSPQPAEGNIESNAEGYKHDAHHAKVKVSCAGPSLDSLGEISAQNTTEKISENHDPVPVSSLHGTDDCIASDLNQLDRLGIESKLNVALQVNNIESSAVSTHEVNGKVANVEPGLDCFGEISAQNKDINEDQDHAAVSMLNGSDESAMQLDSDLNKQSALEVESNSHAASEVVSDEEVALVGRNILPSAEDDVGKEAHEVNVSISSVEPVLNSSGETSAENATFDGSNGSTVQLESDQNHPSAIEMETEGRVDSEVASDAMDCERNI
ncbi:hypothetical protein CsSME_00020917 [Camellia sinensis var. sinensis]